MDVGRKGQASPRGEGRPSPHARTDGVRTNGGRATWSAARLAVNSLPRGALDVGGGLLVLGVTSYGFLLIAARSLTTAQFASLSVLYVLVYTVGPGIFLPFEQEIGRAVADRRVRGVGTEPLLRRAVTLGGAVVTVALVVLIALGPALVPHLFDGSVALLVALLASVVGLWAAYLSRGVFAGNGRFRAYGLQLASEGTVRLLACVALAVVGVHSVGAYGLVLGGAFAVSVLLTARYLPMGSDPGPQAPWTELTGALTWLVVGSLMAQALVNAGPVAVKLLATSGEKDAAGQLLAGLVLARLPLFLFAAIQAALLPRLAALVGAGKLREYRSGVVRLLGAVLALTLFMVALMGVAGPAIVHVMFGARFSLGPLDLVLLSAATGFFMAANVVSNALLALQRFALAALGWTAGAVTLVAIVAVPTALFARIERGFLLGTMVAFSTFGVLLIRSMRSAAASRTDERVVTDVVAGP